MLTTYRYSFDENGRTFLLDRMGKRYDFVFDMVNNGPWFALALPQIGCFEGAEPAAIIREINEKVPGVIIHPFDC